MKPAVIIIACLVVVVLIGGAISARKDKAPEPITTGDTMITTTDPSTAPPTTTNTNTTKPIMKTETIEGVTITTLKEGTGEPAKAGDMVSVHYTGTLDDGTVFDSSKNRGVPFEFKLGAGQVIRGWDIGVLGMRPGEVRKLIIPSDKAYGPNGISGVIPGGATLTFEVEFLGVK